MVRSKSIIRMSVYSYMCTLVSVCVWVHMRTRPGSHLNLLCYGLSNWSLFPKTSSSKSLIGMINDFSSKAFFSLNKSYPVFQLLW